MMQITEQSLRAGKQYEVGCYTIKDSGIYCPVNKDGNVVLDKVCEVVFIEKTIENIDTNEVIIKLTYKYKNKYKSLILSMDVLKPNKLLELLRFGVSIPPEDEKLLGRYLLKLVQQVENECIYSNVGWHKDSQGNLQYRLSEAISSQTASVVAVNNPDAPNFNLKCSGTVQAWVDMCKEEVIGNTHLEAMLCFGFSAPIVGYLYRTTSYQDTLVIHAVGDSTTGKTTAGKLAVSPFGFPDSRDNGIFRTWNGTTNAIIRSLGGNFGVPLVLDEVSMIRNRNISSELYTIASGEDKARLTDNIEQRDRPKWSTTIISTGEKSIFSKASNNAGLRVRVIQFEGITWTSSATNADNIKAVISQNYGCAGVEFGKYIFSKGINIIDERMEYWYNRCLNEIPNSSFKDRVAYKFAIIMTGGDIANQALQLGINLDKVLEFLIENEKNNIPDRDLAEKAFYDVIETIIENMSKFAIREMSFFPKDYWGKIETTSQCYKVVFLKNKLESQLIKLGYEDSKVVIRAWKERGYLLTEKDKTTNRLVVNKNKRETVYVLKVPLDELKSYIPKNSILNS
ncbi:DNA/RNA helicase, superfamily II [Clostridium neonatale]|uniref:DUF927 domain-containing protein n=1 Tax=Clostridium neonatale TaxID=137838 RepID=UPI00291C3429|nr:DUF927 domain-containing protein [Clostridium neonatale]CAI3246757.1 DNA/RNA helicase, superfamily II [Clostridium neonatale]